MTVKNDNYADRAFQMVVESTKYAAIRGAYGFMMVAASQYRICVRDDYRSCTSNISSWDLKGDIHCRLDAKDHCHAPTNFTVAIVGGVVAALFPNALNLFK